MKAWEEYALIKSNTVRQIGCFEIGDYTVAVQLAHEIYGSDAIAVNVTQYKVHVGDTYEEGVFFHDGQPVPQLPTDEQEIAALNDAVDDLIIAITPA